MSVSRETLAPRVLGIDWGRGEGDQTAIVVRENGRVVMVTGRLSGAPMTATQVIESLRTMHDVSTYHWLAPLHVLMEGIVQRLRRPKLLTYPGFPSPFGV